MRHLLLAGFLCGPGAGHLLALAPAGGGGASSTPADCSAVLAGQAASGGTLFRTVALALDRPEIVVTPLHSLERGGVRWEHLTIEGEIAAGRASGVAAVVSLDPPADLVLLHVPGLPACTAEARSGGGAGRDARAGPGLTSGTPVQVLRERSGYRPGMVGGRVERSVDLPDGRRLILARLLDAAGADPGLLLDEAGSLVGSVAPAPPGTDPALVAVVQAAHSPSIGIRTEGPARSILASLPSPSFSGTLAGLVAEALLLGGSGRTESALERLDEAMRRGGDTAPLLLERGALQYSAGRLAAAAADFRRASEADPSSYLARFNLGVVLGATARYDEAAEAFRQACSLAPDNPRARFELALALRAGRHGDAARGEWEALHRLDPTLARELRLLLGF